MRCATAPPIASSPQRWNSERLPPRTFSLAQLKTLLGEEIGCSDWLLIDQARINAFADATSDHQWIHVDTARAEAELGGTIAHGFLTLSLMSLLAAQVFRLSGVSKRLNYGFDRLRFTQAVACGQRVRLRMILKEMGEKGQGHMMTFDCTMEIDGSSKPALVAAWKIVAIEDQFVAGR